ncbi:MAG TPA: indolepyruvate ferredoxin oxidoreductase family protein [Burkholderiaceae bacterium]|nr:indolepyruvate ferredoxin oxidoreductase family protein [Burkholderiaceae bacterium]
MPGTTLDTRYQLTDNLTATSGRIYLTGPQALVRMALSQRRIDAARGLNTAGFVSGYRGSPLAGVDMAMWRAQALLEEAHVRFLPAVNEDMAATMMMGTQQTGERADRTVEGVFGMWYGKGPGVDRAGDAIHHGNAAGASRHGGVLMIVGDDHTAASSSIGHASETSLTAWSIPIINPSSIEEYEYFGLWGWALSRFCGAWVAFKAITETVESGRSFELQSIPDFSACLNDPRAGKLQYSAREFLTPAMEHRIAERLTAVQAFSQLHRLDRLVNPAPQGALGLVTTGKATLDTEEALRRLARSGAHLPPIRHYKVGLTWPLDRAGLDAFVDGLEHILVVEEKAPIVENQIKELLFNRARRPTVQGKTDLRGQPLVTGEGQLNPTLVATALRGWLRDAGALTLPEPTGRAPVLDPATTHGLARRPYFCSGCPHSTSTKVPEGSQALAGVGCHYMATWMDRDTSGLTQMGGEGVDWIGLAPFTRTPHVFQNMGEGTYFHSGYLAIRQAVAAQAHITYKILFNDAVAMTGGQPVDGHLSVPDICRQMLGEGVARVVITTDEPQKYQGVPLVQGVAVHDRHELDSVQRELRDIPGVTVLIHDQACAAEKRRRRKKKAFPDPPRRLFINTAVCEGCGDCGTQSNCLSLVPVETPFGRKRAIDQSSCNKDYSCVDGFCPSFVSVMGGTPRRSARIAEPGNQARLETLRRQLPDPVILAGGEVCNILVAGIGGSGVVTLGALLAMAAHLEGRAVSTLDVTGLAQKGGAVISHVRLARGAQARGVVRIDQRQADVAILCDPVAAARPDIVATLKPSATLVTLSTYLAPTAEFTRDPDTNLDASRLVAGLRDIAGAANTRALDAHELALSLMGDAQLSNVMMLGFTWQRGAIPLDRASVERAITLNGVAVPANLQAFELGRIAAWQPDTLDKMLHPSRQSRVIPFPESLDTVVERCRDDLTGYQSAAYAKTYTDTVAAVARAEQALHPQAKPVLALAVARSLHKLMAYKDEYEVARLFSDGRFRRELQSRFEGDFTLRFHLAPPLLARRDPRTGAPRKMTFGPAMEAVFRVLAHGRRLRGTWLDVFGYSAERRTERRLARQYRARILDMLGKLNERTFPIAVELAALPDMVRGFGHVKQASIDRYDQRLAEMTRTLSAEPGHPAHTPSVVRRAG